MQPMVFSTFLYLISQQVEATEALPTYKPGFITSLCPSENFYNRLDIFYPEHLVANAPGCPRNPRVESMWTEINRRAELPAIIFKGNSALRLKFASAIEDFQRTLEFEFSANEAVIRDIVDIARRDNLPKGTIQWVRDDYTPSLTGGATPRHIDSLEACKYPSEFRDFYFSHYAEKILSWIQKFTKDNGINENNLLNELYFPDLKKRILAYTTYFYPSDRKLLLKAPYSQEVYMTKHFHGSVRTALSLLAMETRDPKRTPKFYAVNN